MLTLVVVLKALAEVAGLALLGRASCSCWPVPAASGTFSIG